jgi:DNA-directed RNA polymerase beta subunit
MVPDKERQASERRVFPSEARERLTSYRAKLAVRIKWVVSGDDGEEATYEETKDCGLLPIMVKVRRSSRYLPFSVSSRKINLAVKSMQCERHECSSAGR